MNTAANITVIPAKRKDLTESGTGVMTKVAAYCRVSTEQENQQNSYATQISYYTEYITSNPDWQLVGIYADEGISGTRTKNRTQFNKMIRAARRKKIDLILCKSISRFARNTVDCLDYVRELKSLGVTVIFEKENINTSSMSSEFAISLYASFAQAESESISKNVTWGIEKSYREGNVHYRFHQMLGYRLGEDGKPVIVEEEAEIVRFIFNQYVEGHTPSEIARELTKMGAKRRNGSTEWKRHHVYQILINEKYVGDAILQKSYTVDCITHERKKNSGQRPMFLIQDCHEPIIDRKTYDTVRLELEKRKWEVKRGKPEKGTYCTKYGLSRLLICPYCGGFYRRTTWVSKGEKVGVWRCKNRMEGQHCPKSPSYHEDKLQRTILTAINGMIDRMDEVDSTAEKSSQQLTAKVSDIESQIRDINEKLAEIEHDRETILSAISGSMFEEMSADLKELNRQESRYAEQLETLKQRENEHRRNLLKEESARKVLQDLEPLTEFDDTVVGRILAKVEAISKTKIAVTFCGGYKVEQEIVEE